MKRSLLFMFGLLIAQLAFGQQGNIEEKARAATDELVELYSLRDSQVDDMYTIQLRKYRNLEEIAPLKNTAYLKYIQKLKSIERGINASMEWMLNDNQKKTHYKALIELRKKRAEIARRMQDQSASKQEIEIAMQLAYFEK